MKLSIIVPIYNVEAYLPRCIDSILAQTFLDYELILVDDGSPDNCGSICDEYAQCDNRIKVIHKKNGGLADARNAGLTMARGQYIGFVDGDDSIAPQMYERMLEVAQSQRAQMVSCGILKLDPSGNILGRWPEQTHDWVYKRDTFIDNLYPQVRTEFTPSVCNKVFHRDLFRSVRFPLGKIYEDSFIQLRLLDGCDTVAVCHEHFYHYYYLRQDSIMNSPYSARCMDAIDFALDNYRFYEEKGVTSQQDYTLAIYANSYMQSYFQVSMYHRELRPQLSPYTQQFKALLPQIMKNPQICRLKRLVIRILFFHKRLAYKICKKKFPECIFGN